MKYAIYSIALILLSTSAISSCANNTANTESQSNSAETQKANSRDAQDELSREISRPSRSY